MIQSSNEVTPGEQGGKTAFEDFWCFEITTAWIENEI